MAKRTHGAVITGGAESGVEMASTELVLTEHGIKLMLHDKMKICNDGVEIMDYSPEALIALLNEFKVVRLVFQTKSAEGYEQTITLVPRID